MTDVLIPVLFILAAAVLRLIDGGNTGVPNGLRVAGFVALAVGGAVWAGHGWPALWIGGWAAVSIVLGHTCWEDPVWQVIRFGGLAALAVLPLGWDGGLYIYGVICAALSYGPLVWLDRKIGLPRRGLLDGPEAYYRLQMGSAVIGGCAFL